MIWIKVMICKLRCNLSKKRSILNTFFPFIFATGSYFHFWLDILLIAACNIFIFKWTIFTKECSASLLIWLLFLLRSSTNAFLVFKNIAHALYKHKRPCKAGREVHMGKKYPTKARSRFYESGVPVGGIIHFLINRFWFFNWILL